MPSRRQIIAMACALLVPPSAGAAPALYSLPAKFDPSRDAARDVEAALEVARQTRRRVLVEVGGEWCSWCHIMDRFFAANPELKSLRDERFVWLKINYSKQNDNQAVLSRWPKVAGYPH